MLRYTVYGDLLPEECPAPLKQLVSLGERGKLGRTLHAFEGQSSSWDRLCALEADMLQASTPHNPEHEGWLIVAGECVLLDDVAGWLECDDWVFVACPPGYQAEHETDWLVLPYDEFAAEFVPYARARAPLGEDSGLRLNRALREVADMEAAYVGEGGA